MIDYKYTTIYSYVFVYLLRVFSFHRMWWWSYNCCIVCSDFIIMYCCKRSGLTLLQYNISLHGTCVVFQDPILFMRAVFMLADSTTEVMESSCVNWERWLLWVMTSDDYRVNMMLDTTKSTKLMKYVRSEVPSHYYG